MFYCIRPTMHFAHKNTHTHYYPYVSTDAYGCSICMCVCMYRNLFVCVTFVFSNSLVALATYLDAVERCPVDCD